MNKILQSNRVIHFVLRLTKCPAAMKLSAQKLLSPLPKTACRQILRKVFRLRAFLPNSSCPYRLGQRRRANLHTVQGKVDPVPIRGASFPKLLQKLLCLPIQATLQRGRPVPSTQGKMLKNLRRLTL